MVGMDKRAVRTAWSHLAVLLTLYGVYMIRSTILIFVLALTLAYLLHPLIGFLRRRTPFRSQIAALAILFAGAPLVFAGTAFVLQAQVQKEAVNLYREIQSEDFANDVQQWKVLGVPVGKKLVAIDSIHRAQARAMNIEPEIQGRIIALSGDLADVIIVPIISFFMLKDGKRIVDTLLHVWFHPANKLNRNADRQTCESVLDDAHRLFLDYMRSLVTSCFTALVVFAVVLSLLEVRYALLLALLVFPLEFLPLIGPLLAGVSIVAVCEFNRYPHTGRVIMFLIIYRLIQDYLISPYLLDKTVKMPPLMIIFGISAGGQIAGVGGMFLSVPLLAIARLLLYEYGKRVAATQMNVAHLTLDAIPTAYRGSKSRVR